MKINLCIPLFLLLILVSCGSKRNSISKIEFPFGEITVPENWTVVQSTEKIDSYGGFIITTHKDTFFYEMGLFSNSLTENNIEVLPSSARSIVVDTVGIIFENEDVIANGIDLDKYRKQNVFFDTISNLPCKLIFPRLNENGLTGVHFDSVNTTPLGVQKFTLYGRNIKTATSETFREMIKTIKFKTPK